MALNLNEYEQFEHIEFGPSRLYRTSGGGIEIIVPESYARELDEESRLAAQPVDGFLGAFSVRVVAHDLPPIIEELPDRSIIKSIVLSAGPNAGDGQLAGTFGAGFAAASTSQAGGLITLYRLPRDASLRERIFHEWSHLLMNLRAAEAHYFALASRLEQGGFCGSPLAAAGLEEDWAVHLGEWMLAEDSDFFWTFAYQAPLRAAVLGQALSVVLEQCLEDDRSCQHREIDERVQYVRQHILPLAQAILMSTIESADSAAAVDCAARLLLFIGEESHLAALNRPAVLDLSSEPVGDPVLRKLSAMSFLTELDLANTYVGGQDMSYLAGLVNLRRLGLRRTRAANTGMRALKDLSALEILDLRSTLITDSALPYLSGLKGLKVLDLRDTKTSEARVRMLSRDLPGCQIFR